MSYFDIAAYIEDCRRRLRKMYHRCVEDPNSKSEISIVNRSVVIPNRKNLFPLLDKYRIVKPIITAIDSWKLKAQKKIAEQKDT